MAPLRGCKFFGFPELCYQASFIFPFVLLSDGLRVERVPLAVQDRARRELRIAQDQGRTKEPPSIRICYYISF